MECLGGAFADPKGGKAKAAAINSAVALAAMLLLKRHLRAAYALTDQRVQAFNPQEQPQKEAATRLSEDAFDMTCLDLGASSSEHRSEKLYKVPCNPAKGSVFVFPYTHAVFSE